MAQFQLYNYQFGQIRDVMPDLFSGKVYMSAEEAFPQKQQILGKLFDDDYNKKEEIKFTGKSEKKEYTHKYLMPPTDDIIIMRVANKKIRGFINAKFERETKEDFPNCIVIIDNRPGIQRIAIEVKKHVFQKDVTLTNILEYSLSKVLRGYSLNIELLKIQNSQTFWSYVNDTQTYPQGFYKVKFRLPHINLDRLHSAIDRLVDATRDMRMSMDSDFSWEQTAQPGGKINLSEDNEEQKRQISYMMDVVGGESVGLVPNGNKNRTIWMNSASSFCVAISNPVFTRIQEDAAGNTLFGSPALDIIKAKTTEGI